MNGTDSSTALATPPRRPRLAVAALALLGVAVAVAASLYVLDNATEAPEANAIVRAIMALTALGVGLYLWQRQPHNRYGLVLAAGVFVLSPMALAVSQDPWTFTIGRTVAAVAIIYAAFLALIFPDGRAEEKSARLVLAATVVGSVVLWTTALLFADRLPAGGPLIPCFEDCPANAAQIAETSPDPSEALGLAYGVFCAAIGLAVAGLLLRRLRDATPVRSRAIGPVLAVIVPVCIGMGAYIFIRELSPDSALLDPLGWLVLGAFLLFPFVICVGLIRGRVFAASALEALVERLGGKRSPAEVEDAMRAALRDPSLEFMFWSSSRSSYVDAGGRALRLPDNDVGRSVTKIDRDGHPIAAIVHDPALDSHPDAIRALASTALLARENARLEEDREAIVLEERRRIARDFHDGVAQDLAFITMHGRELADQHPQAEGIASAAHRALTDSRAAMLSLTAPNDEHLTAAVANTAIELSDRSGIGLELELDDGADADPKTQEELLRILREAISNATRHGNASNLHIRISAQPTLRLAISDDGCGFDTGAAGLASNGRFGLNSMRERAEDLGGELHLRSRPGEGTVVEVALP